MTDTPTTAELVTLLTRARKVLETYLVDDDDVCRDDVAQVCAAIDDAIPEPAPVVVAKKSARRKAEKHPDWNLIPEA
jgi:hypothetical protein